MRAAGEGAVDFPKPGLPIADWIGSWDGFFRPMRKADEKVMGNAVQSTPSGLDNHSIDHRGGGVPGKQGPYHPVPVVIRVRNSLGTYSKVYCTVLLVREVCTGNLRTRS